VEIVRTSKYLYALLIIVLALTFWTAFKDAPVGDDLMLPAQSNRGNKLSISKGNQLQKIEPVLLWQGRTQLLPNAKAIDLFQTHSWEINMPKQKESLAPTPQPVAPPAPFSYIGKIEDTPKGSLMLMMANNQLFTTVEGEKINAQWRLDAENATALMLTYLPLNLPQVLSKNARPMPNQAASAATEITVNNSLRND